MEPECKVDFLTWYQANKITADRIINDLKKQSFEAVMHLYAYTAKSRPLQNLHPLNFLPYTFRRMNIFDQKMPLEVTF